MFSTVMYERHNTSIAVFGGDPKRPIQYKGTTPSTILRREWMLTFAFAGMAGNQVLGWPDLDSEIKTAGLKHVKKKCHLPHVLLAHRLS